MNKETRNVLHLALAAVPKVEAVINRLYAKSNHFQTSAANEADKPPFIVPMLGFRKQGALQLFSEEHFLDLPWRLDECDANGILDRFKLSNSAKTGQIDVTKEGMVVIDFAKRLQGELSAVVREPGWTVAILANWIDSGIQHFDITKPSAILFIFKAIEALIKLGFDLSLLARNKYELRKAIALLIEELRGERETGQYNALFAVNASSFAMSSDLSIIFDEQSYAPNRPYSGTTSFHKHYTPLIGDLEPSGEEFECAVYLDQHPKVRYWIRNIDRKKGSFWLQLPHQKFYPDFMAMLIDGRTLAVEYKGAHLYDGEGDKRRIGDVWAAASEGKCLFVMPTARNFTVIDAAIG